jgi:hypothetical protein
VPTKKYTPGKYFTGEPCKNGHIAERWNYNGMCVECKREADRASNIKAGKKYRVKKLYGLSLDQVEAIKHQQNNKCAICEDELSSTHETQIDHCHHTGKVRGLLCINCNWLLGKSRDNPDLLRSAANYLETTKESKCLTEVTNIHQPKNM